MQPLLWSAADRTIRAVVVVSNWLAGHRGPHVRGEVCVGGASMTTERARSRCLERLDRLADSTSDLDVLRREAIVELRRGIGFERWCALLLDPDTLVKTNGIGDNDFYADLPRLNVRDGRLRDVNNTRMLARGRDHVAALSTATAGDLARSWRWREVYAGYGVGDELRALVTDERGCWGDFHLFRDSDEAPFDARDAQLMRDAARVLARAMRRGSVTPSASAQPVPDEVGVLVLDDDLRPRQWTTSAHEWFAALNPARVPFPGGVPNVGWSVVGHLLAGEDGEDPERPSRGRARAADGSWAVVEAARLEGRDGGIAVTIRPASTEDILDLLCRAHGLSARERQLVALLVDGLDTSAIASRLCISRYTVQDHLKSVFEKVGCNSRRELTCGVFARTP